MSAIDQLNADRAARATAQDAINQLFADHGTTAALLALRLRAEHDNVGYRQYDGYFAGPEWGIAKVSCQIRSKGGIQAETGDIVLYRSNGNILSGTYDATFYSNRLGWLCSVAYGVHKIREAVA